MKYDKYQIISTIIWGLCLLIVLVFFIGFKGAEVMQESVTVRLSFTFLFFVAWITQLMNLRVNKKQLIDERMNTILRKSSTRTLMVVMAWVLLASWAIYSSFGETSMIPATWLWFIAVSTYCLGLFVNSMTYLILESEDQGYED